MSKLNKAVNVVKATGAEDKELCLAAIMAACDTYRSNATIYYNKAIAIINGPVVTRETKGDKGSPKAKRTVTRAFVAPVLSDAEQIVDSMVRKTTEEFNAMNAERAANGMDRITRETYVKNRSDIDAFNARQAA